jgi:hypothetical protein
VVGDRAGMGSRFACRDTLARRHLLRPRARARPTCRAAAARAPANLRATPRYKNPRAPYRSVPPHRAASASLLPFCLGLALATGQPPFPASLAHLQHSIAMASRAAVLLFAVAAVLFAAASAQEMDMGMPPAPAPVMGAAAGTAASAVAVACSAVFSILVAGGLVQ